MDLEERTLDDTIWRLFDQLEWRASEHWLFQGGAMFEDTWLTGSSLTPRAAVNYRINPRHGLRPVYSEAIRSPDMFENNVNWSYRVTNLNPKAYGQSSAQFDCHECFIVHVVQPCVKSLFLLIASIGNPIEIEQVPFGDISFLREAWRDHEYSCQ